LRRLQQHAELTEPTESFRDFRELRVKGARQAHIEAASAKRMAKRRDKGEERALAERRIRTLLARARAEHLAAPGSALPDRYAALSLRVAQKYQTGLPADAKAQVCRACGAYRTPATSRTRLSGGRIATTCLRCGAVARRPLARRPAARPSKSPV
jgi:RNase P subunit RPR2